jgi:hypothetical protein
MKRISPPRTMVLMAVMLAVLLSACSSAPVKSVYTASGTGSRPADLRRTTTFAGNDDLNVVITLNAHSRTLDVSAVFTAPTGETYATDPLAADSTTGQVVLGLSWAAQGSIPWPAGQWKVEVYVDDLREKTLEFAVQPSPTTPSAG